MIKLLKRIYFKLMNKIILYFTQVIAPLHSPWTRKKTRYSDVKRAISKIQDGDIILTRTQGELTTILIPGYWKHMGICTKNHTVIEAKSYGVVESSLVDVIMRTDYFAIMRIFNITQEEISRLLEKARSFIGKEYDFSLEIWDEDKLYCSEVGFHTINYAMGVQYIELRERLGYETMTPNDYYKAKKKFNLIYEKRG